VLTINKNRNTSLKICVYLFCILGLLFSSPKNTTSYAATRNDLGFPFPDCQNWYVFQGYNSLHQGQFLYAFDLVKDNRWDALDTTGGASIVAAATGRVYGSPYQINGPNGINWGKGFKMILDDGMILEYDHLMNLPSYLVNNTVITKGTEVGKVFNGKPGGVNHLHFQTVPTEALNFGLWHYPSTGPSDGNGTWSGTKIVAPCVSVHQNDYNGDGKPDLYAIAKTGGGAGKTDLYILNGADNYQSYLLMTATVLGYTDDPAWTFSIGDYNGDGKPDLYAIAKTGGGAGKTDLYVLNGADNYQSYLLMTATVLGYTDGPTWAFSVGDYNGDGKPDLYAIAKTGGGAGKTDLYVLNGADNYQSYLLMTATVLGYSNPICNWDFATGEAACVVASLTPSPTSMTPSPTPSTTVTPSPTSMTPSPTPSTTVTSSPTSSATVTPSPTSVTPSPTPVTSHYSVYLPMIQR
jgi:FG-GAP-like repeat